MDYASKKRPEQPPVNAARSGILRKKIGRWLFRGAMLLPLVGMLWWGVDYYWREMRWRYIIIHHTASDTGNMEYYRTLHMRERNWPDIAYHFVVDNGSYNTSVGQIEESDLWKTRKPNLSTKVSYKILIN
jgi:hypothetical protein